MGAKYLLSHSYNVYTKREVRIFLIGNAISNVLLSCLWSDDGAIKSKGLFMQMILWTLSGCYSMMAITNNMDFFRANMTFVLGINIVTNLISAKRAHIYDYGSLLINIANTSVYGMIYSTM